jgi:hypothetical protein
MTVGIILLDPRVSATKAMLVKRLLLVAASVAAIDIITYGVAGLKPHNCAYISPSVPPTYSDGINSPPLPPKFNVKLVSTIFRIKIAISLAKDA